MTASQPYEAKARMKFAAWRNDWNLFAYEVLGAVLDSEQQAILKSVQYNPRTTVASGTARGKDFVSAVAALCFLYLTPKWNDRGELVENTKVALTAPTSRQVTNIMTPEFSRLFNAAKKRGFDLPGRLVSQDIRTDYEEWFLTGFKADEHNHEAWSGFHAVNTMFVVTEASGIPESIFSAIEGNLQGNSRILTVFNPNVSTGYAAQSQKSTRWHKFRLDSLNAPNVVEKQMIIPGQVDYEWVKDKVETWCQVIPPEQYLESEGDFNFEGTTYRPNDLFRVKVRGMFPKVSTDVLIPHLWIEMAIDRWKAHKGEKAASLRLGVDVAGMGRDSSSFCYRYGNYVQKFRLLQSGGVANHMEVVGIVKHELTNEYDVSRKSYPQAFIDTIGEGAGVQSRLEELQPDDRILSKILIHSVKAGAKAEYDSYPLTDITGQYKFKNLRAYLYWATRDWLNPDNKTGAMLPPDFDYAGLSDLKWNMMSDGSVELEKKEDLKKRIGRSPDVEDSLALTFYPAPELTAPAQTVNNLSMFYPF